MMAIFRFHKDFIQFLPNTIAGQKDIALTLHLMKYKATSNAPEVDHPDMKSETSTI